MHDEQIVKLFLNRSEKAVEEFTKKYQNLTFTIANNILGDKEDSEECVNSTYLKLWNSIPPAHPKSLKAYFSKIVRNLAIDKIKQNSRLKRGSDDIFAELDECIASNENTEVASDHTIINLINEFLEEIEPITANLFVNRYFYGYSIKFIAKKYGLTETNTSTKILRARNKLKEKLIKEGVYL